MDYIRNLFSSSLIATSRLQITEVSADSISHAGAF